jgi:hypothetical protein
MAIYAKIINETKKINLEAFFMLTRRLLQAK